MRNIHVLATDRPSRLQLQMNGELHLENGETIILKSFQHIYITSDEEIKEGDAYYNPRRNLIQKAEIDSDFNTLNQTEYKPQGKKAYSKVILTTDPDLIADGVQAIDDDFLQWFVKNPSYKDVDISWYTVSDKRVYKIVIPQEKAKEDLEKEMFELEQELDIPSHLRWHNSKPKQKTLEEAAEKYAIEHWGGTVMFEDNKKHYIKLFMDGAKWQAENSQQIVPPDATDIEVFSIKPSPARDGKMFAYIGYKVSNGNFHFSVVPFTEPQFIKKQQDYELSLYRVTK